MDLDRETIEKNDFPIGRRGYDPGAVDAHLREVAREVLVLRQAARAPADESLASAASARVQAILDAAEATAATLKREGQAEARRLREEAEGGAEQARDGAVARAEEHVQVVAKAAAGMLERLAALESEMNQLVEGVRAGVQRVSADLDALRADLGELYDAAGAPAAGTAASPGGEGTGDEVAARSPADRQAPAAASPPEPARAPKPARARDASPKPARGREAERARPAANGGGGGSDIDGARLIALNMALSGQSREEAERYLEENFQLADPRALVDEAFSEVDD